MRIIKTDGISFVEILSEGSSWYCGTDYACGDLYEAEEVYEKTGSCKENRLIFIHHPDGRVYEPIKLEPGQYFGRPLEIDGIIYILLVDFSQNTIKILECSDSFAQISELVALPKSQVEDCYSLLLHGDPLMLTRQGHEGYFELVWPEKIRIPLEANETFVRREGDKLLFSTWFEDPDYREELIVRAYPSGEVVERIPGGIFIPPCKESWVLQ